MVGDILFIEESHQCKDRGSFDNLSRQRYHHSSAICIYELRYFCVQFLYVRSILLCSCRLPISETKKRETYFPYAEHCGFLQCSLDRKEIVSISVTICYCALHAIMPSKLIIWKQKYTRPWTLNSTRFCKNQKEINISDRRVYRHDI